MKSLGHFKSTIEFNKIKSELQNSNLRTQSIIENFKEQIIYKITAIYAGDSNPELYNALL